MPLNNRQYLCNIPLQNHCSYCYILNTGSLLHPLSLTPRDVGSMRKWRTSSLAGSFALFWRLGGGVATFSASPNAPGKELESRTTNVPGA